jgi:hypothetical protein
MAVAGGAADARALARILLVEKDPHGEVEGSMAEPPEVVGELLEPRLVAYRRMRIGGARRRLRRVASPLAVHLVEVLGLGVIGLELVVGNGPGG